MTRDAVADDAPRGRTAAYFLVTAGYLSSPEHPGKTAGTVSYVEDGDLRIVVDPGMVADHSLILRPLEERGVRAADVTDVILSHHHPDNVLNAGLFANARVHDHWAIYHHDVWIDRRAEGHELSASVRLIETPGHSPQDITALIGTPHGIIACSGDLWLTPAGPDVDSVTPDRELLRKSRQRVLRVADVIVAGHGEPFRPTRYTPV